ncbi:MAG: carboxypeptidase regulatory-like domain-containing protein [Acidobacteriota bacterium]
MSARPIVALGASFAAAALAVSAAPPEATSPPATPPEPTGVILTGTIASALTDEPIANAGVQILTYPDQEAVRERLAARDFFPTPLAAGLTDETGRFRLAVPASRRVVVAAWATGHARSRYRRLIRTGDAGTQRDLGSLWLSAGRRITGKVVDANGKPVSTATVVALVPGGTRRGGGRRGGFFGGFGRAGTAFVPVVARTGATGSFTLESVPRRAVTVRAYAPDLAPAVRAGVRQSARLLLRLEPGQDLSGRVVSPGGKKPVEGAWILAGPEGWDGATRSDADGRFHLRNLRRGTVSIVATTAGTILSGVTAGVPASARWAASAPARARLPRPAEAPPLIIKMRPGGLVSARIVDEETREPMAGVLVALTAPGEKRPRLATTRQEGAVIFTGVPAGSVRVAADAAGYLRQEGTPAELAAGGTRAISLALRAAAAVAGTVRDATGRPLVGAEVRVAGPPPRARSLPIPIFLPIGVDPVTTDSQGHFALEGLPPRVNLQVSVTLEGFVPWQRSGITLRPGERREPMEVLLATGSILSGRLVDQEGNPVEGARVSARRRREGSRSNMMVLIGRRRGHTSSADSGEGPEPVTSDEDGVFRVRGMKPGVWTLTIKSPGFAPKKVAGLKLEQEGESRDAGEIVLEPGVVIEGYVQSSTGEPIPFARGILKDRMFPISEFTCESDGHFVSDDLAPGDIVDLTVEADGYASFEKPGLTAPVEGLMVTLSPSSKVRGEVIDQETREPIPQFSISISRSRSMGGAGMRVSMAMRGPATSFQSEDGTFTIEDVDPGKISVHADAPGYREAVISELTVPEGEDLEGVRLLLRRAASVSGMVVDDRGRPLPNVGVERKQTSGGMGIRIRAGGGSATTTDADGRFELDGLERGPMTLTFSHPGFETSETDIDTTEDVRDLRVSLSRGMEIAGTVLSEEGAPIAEATVTASAAGSDRFGESVSATTAPDGTFVLEGLPEGRYAVKAEATGLQPAVQNGVVLSSGVSPPPLELRMSGGVSLRGEVTGIREDELAQVSVNAVRPGGGFGVTAPVDASGRFEMRGLRPGPVTLVARSGILGGRSLSKTVEIPAGTTEYETTIDFPAGSNLEGTVTRGSEPVQGATIIFINSATRNSITARTDQAGNYLAEDIEEGDYEVTVLQFSTGLSHRTEVTVHADDRFDIELPLATIAGFVTDSQAGDPIDGAHVSIKKVDGTAASTRMGLLLQRGASTDATGYYTLEGLDDGTYEVTASGPGHGFQTRIVVLAPDLEPDEVSFVLPPTEGFTFRAIDAASGLALRSLTGLVLVGGGDPLAPAGSGSPVIFQGRLSADASGLFHIDSLLPGTYRLVLGGQGLGTTTIQEVEVPATEQQYTLSPGGVLEVRSASLAAGATARAVLLDAQGRPVYPRTILPEPIFLLRGGRTTTLTDLPAGSFTLRLATPDGQISDTPIAITAGQLTAVKLP